MRWRALKYAAKWCNVDMAIDDTAEAAAKDEETRPNDPG
jgi:hypothetical protein